MRGRLAIGVLLSGLLLPGAEIPISKASPAAAVKPRVGDEFDRFFSAYADLLRQQLRDAGSTPWQFWVSLIQDPRRGAKPRVVVAGRAGNLEVRIADFSPSGSLTRVRGAVQRSVALWRDPFLGALANGDAPALAAPVRRRGRR